uniref:Uncharacterized protein n=1 Tax=Trypanosoma congolense (strain IL3000) TaxID=1068625 RepID=G0UM19_TRYCI|nr:hypothetical protein, unlikely [Trypanosoma congolense IL3000]
MQYYVQTPKSHKRVTQRNRKKLSSCTLQWVTYQEREEKKKLRLTEATYAPPKENTKKQCKTPADMLLCASGIAKGVGNARLEKKMKVFFTLASLSSDDSP